MASWGYETLLGVADFAAATLAGWGNIGTTLTILATERGTERFLQVLDQGGTMEQAFWSGVTTGALDRILNKLPVEKLLGKSSGKVRQTLWKTMKEQGLLQMGSEAAGRVTDIVADTVVMGEQSEYKRLEAQYLKQGLNRKEARRQALLDLAGSVAVSGGSGLVQGAALGSVAQLARRLFQMGNSGAEIEQEQPVQYINAEPGSPEDNVRDLYAYYRKQAQIDSNTLSAEENVVASAQNDGTIGTDQKDLKIKLEYITTSGLQLKAVPNKTTTILGTYADDMESIIGELAIEKSLDFGPRDGGFNVLNTPDELYNQLGPEEFWDQYNRPWLDNVIARGDIIKIATEPSYPKLYRINNITGQEELTGFGREFMYLKEKEFIYDSETKSMVKKRRGGIYNA